MSHQLKVIISVQLIFWFVCRSSCSSNHQQHQHRVESPFVDVPPNVFAPRGRLYKVEDAVHTITSSEEDVSSTSCIVLTCSNGSVVAISTLPHSPYLTLHSEVLPPDQDFEQEQIIDVSLCLRDCITADMHSEWDDYTVVPPFGRIQWPKQAPTRIIVDRNHINHTAVEFSKNSIYSGPQSNCIAFSLTAGNAVESQILRHRIYQTIERIVTEKGLSASSSITSALARMMADQNQQRTQILSNGRIMAASAILIEFATKMNHDTNEKKRSSTSTIYQIESPKKYRCWPPENSAAIYWAGLRYRVQIAAFYTHHRNPRPRNRLGLCCQIGYRSKARRGLVSRFHRFHCPDGGVENNENDALPPTDKMPPTQTYRD